MQYIVRLNPNFLIRQGLSKFQIFIVLEIDISRFFMHGYETIAVI